jgi:hypothetical protein
MTIAGNQSYFFPYIGYFQLINAVDKFIIYDDLTFVNKGWINRNQILIKNAGACLITVPLINRTSSAKIRYIKIDDQNGTSYWRKKLSKTIYVNYRHAPMFDKIFPLVESLINYPTEYLSELNAQSIRAVCNYLKINTIIESDMARYQEIESNLLDEKFTSENYGNIEPKAIRIIEICKYEGANSLYNSLGGVALYSKEMFEKYNILIRFIKTKSIQYKQFDNTFVPNLSIIDVLMFNSIDKIHEMLLEFELI